MGIKNECFGCTKRYIGCHSSCESYAQFREERNKMIESRAAKKRAYPEHKLSIRKNIFSTHMR